MAGQDVKEVVDLVFIEHGHLGGALGALNRVVNLIGVHPSRSWIRSLVRHRLCVLSPPLLPLPLLLHLLLRLVS